MGGISGNMFVEPSSLILKYHHRRCLGIQAYMTEEKLSCRVSKVVHYEKEILKQLDLISSLPRH